ncbi:hypothetical protein L2E71_22250 [Planktothrix agardhii 1032]|uniref:hypothetical protein n=1 Tax=Planktothrix agardhii TaxID=1160 RepID=UPI001D0A0E9A|nr:hypothetical protein [Planktothrix agardhii]MCB8780228.1 hypothetical protein [Planktothrix agardhii 1031]MCF3600791.1 hypothetical protein [Planktothrix agardhii 1032]
MKNKLFLPLILSFGILSIQIVLSGQQPSSANEVYINKMCQRQQDLPQIERFTVFYQEEFSSQNKTYWLYAGRYQDGSVIFCISEPNFNQARELNAEPLQFQFIENISQDSNNNSTFLITVREGNGRNAPLTNYRLDLVNPNQPVLTRL